MILRDLINNVPGRILTASLVALVGLGAYVSRDNLHLGSPDLTGKSGTHYVIGIAPEPIVGDELSGVNIHSYGLFSQGPRLIENSIFNGDISTTTLFTDNTFPDGTTFNGQISARGITASNNFGKGSHIDGEVNSCGVMNSLNSIGDNSEVSGIVSSSGGLVAGNSFGRRNNIEGIAKSKAGFTKQSFGVDSEVTGDVLSTGVYNRNGLNYKNPNRLFSNNVRGLEDHRVY